MNNDLGEGDTSTFVLNGEWHLLGKQKKKRNTKQTKKVDFPNEINRVDKQ